MPLPAATHHRPVQTAPAAKAWWGLLACLGTLGLGGQPATATAQATLPDPTRPPSAVLAATAATGTTAPGGRPVTEPAAPPPPPPPPVLQAVQLPAQGLASALIDGQLVRVGDTVGERFTLAVIDARGVVLRGPAGALRLRLLHADGKQAPGSIVITRSTSFSPETGPRQAPAQGAAGRAEPDNAGAPDNDPAARSSNAPVNVAGRTSP